MKKLKEINVNSILFLDIETVPNWRTMAEAPEYVQKEWIYKFKFRSDAPKPPHREHLDNPNAKAIQNKYNNYFAELWELKAGLYAEFSKIVCISMGYIDGNKARIKTYSQEHEAQLLSEFKNDLSHFCGSEKSAHLCAHYGEGFDYPFINKRLLIHGLNIPSILDTWGFKPWETFLLDTQKIWKFGNYSADSGTLSSIAMAFGIPSPKDDIEGADVARVYYEEKNGLARIAKYCEKDVFTLMQIVKRIRGEELLDQTNN
tara:strand:- start:6791 stop:7567 length:777 start_codon:yes stop_codon:yes gene_type:complete